MGTSSPQSLTRFFKFAIISVEIPNEQSISDFFFKFFFVFTDQCEFPYVDNAIVNVVTANIGSKAVYECLPGFDLLTPTSTLTCLPGGDLDGITPVCDTP